MRPCGPAGEPSPTNRDHNRGILRGQGEKWVGCPFRTPIPDSELGDLATQVLLDDAQISERRVSELVTVFFEIERKRLLQNLLKSVRNEMSPIAQLANVLSVPGREPPEFRRGQVVRVEVEDA